MGLASRELDSEVMGILSETGCHVIGKGRDGAGHQTVTFEVGTIRRTFHYGVNGRLNGHSRRNVTARLRRIVRETRETEKPPAPVTPIAVKPAEPPAVKPPAPAKSKTMTRAQLAKRYVALRSIEKLAAEVGITASKLYNQMIAAGGQASELARAERSRARAKIAEARRNPPPVITPQTITPASPPVKKTRLRGAAALKRNIEIARLVYRKKMDPGEVAKMFEMNIMYVAKIAHDHFPLLNKKAA